MHHSSTHKDRGLVQIWRLIGIIAIFSLVLTAIGWMDWTPPQANVPTTNEAVDIDQATASGGLRLGN